MECVILNNEDEFIEYILMKSKEKKLTEEILMIF